MYYEKTMNKFNFKITIKEEEFKTYLSNPKAITSALEHLIQTGIIGQNKDIDINIDLSTDQTNTNLAKLILCLNDKELLTQVETLFGEKIGDLELLNHYKKIRNKNGQDDFIDVKNLLSFSDDYSLLLTSFSNNEEINDKIHANLGLIFIEKIKEHLSELPTAMLRIQMNGYSRDILDFCRIHINYEVIPEVLNLLKNTPDFNELFNEFREMEKIYHSQFTRLYELNLISIKDVKEDDLVYVMRNNVDLFEKLIHDGLDLHQFNVNEILSHASDVRIANLLVNFTQAPVLDEETILSNLSPSRIDLETFKYYSSNLYSELLKDKKLTDKLIKQIIEKSNYNDEVKDLAWDKIIFLKNTFGANIKNKNMLSLFNCNENEASEEDLKKKQFCYEQKVELYFNKYFTNSVSHREVKNLNQINKKYPKWLGPKEAYYILEEGTTSQLVDFLTNKMSEQLFVELNSYIKPCFSVRRRQDVRAIRQTYKALFSQDININEKTTAGNTMINHFLNHYSDKGKYEDRVTVHDILDLSKTEIIDASAVNQYGNNPLFGIFKNSHLNYAHDKTDKDGNIIKKVITKEQMIKKMINVDLNHQNKDGNTLFHYLISQSSNSSYSVREAMKILLSLYNFDASLKNKDDKTVIDLLSETNTSQHLIVDFEKILLENGVNQEVKSQVGRKIKI
jgi:hypothetical protein